MRFWFALIRPARYMTCSLQSSHTIVRTSDRHGKASLSAQPELAHAMETNHGRCDISIGPDWASGRRSVQRLHLGWRKAVVPSSRGRGSEWVYTEHDPDPAGGSSRRRPDLLRAAPSLARGRLRDMEILGPDPGGRRALEGLRRRHLGLALSRRVHTETGRNRCAGALVLQRLCQH